MKNKYILGIIILDLFWSAAALTYDFSVISNIPFYLFPFMVICSIYPLLLAICWFSLYCHKPINSYLLSFSAIPSIAYTLLAIYYYPVWMVINGFDWLALGQIFWVMAYGTQAIYLISKNKLSTAPTILVIAFLLISFTIQYLDQGLAGFDLNNFNDFIILLGYGFAIVMATILIGSAHNKKSSPLSDTI